jgi:hypothetical protein
MRYIVIKIIQSDHWYSKGDFFRVLPTIRWGCYEVWNEKELTLIDIKHAIEKW